MFHTDYTPDENRRIDRKKQYGNSKSERVRTTFAMKRLFSELQNVSKKE